MTCVRGVRGEGRRQAGSLSLLREEERARATLNLCVSLLSSQRTVNGAVRRVSKLACMTNVRSNRQRHKG